MLLYSLARYREAKIWEFMCMQTWDDSQIKFSRWKRNCIATLRPQVNSKPVIILPRIKRAPFNYSSSCKARSLKYDYLCCHDMLVRILDRSWPVRVILKIRRKNVKYDILYDFLVVWDFICISPLFLHAGLFCSHQSLFLLPSVYSNINARLPSSPLPRYISYYQLKDQQRLLHYSSPSLNCKYFTSGYFSWSVCLGHTGTEREN